MTKIVQLALCAAIIFLTFRSVNAEDNVSRHYKGYKGASGVIELLYTKRHLNLTDDGRDFIRDACLNIGVNEQDVIQELTNRIAMSGVEGTEVDFSRLYDARSRSSKASFFAMCIYPGNEQIERAVFDTSRWELDHHPSNFSGCLSLIRTYGSLELLAEMNALISNHPSLSAQDANKFISYLHESKKNIKRSHYTASTRSKSSIIVFLSIAVAVCVIFFWFARMKRSSREQSE